MSLQYVVYDYWDYGYAEGDAILEFGSASVSAVATVSANGIRVQTAAAITLVNQGAGSLSEAVVINFAIIKGSTS